MTPDEEALQERIALIWDGAPSNAPITWSEAERLARQWQQDRQRLPLVTPKIRVD